MTVRETEAGRAETKRPGALWCAMFLAGVATAAPLEAQVSFEGQTYSSMAEAVGSVASTYERPWWPEVREAAGDLLAEIGGQLAGDAAVGLVTSATPLGRGGRAAFAAFIDEPVEELASSVVDRARERSDTRLMLERLMDEAGVSEAEFFANHLAQQGAIGALEYDIAFMTHLQEQLALRRLARSGAAMPDERLSNAIAARRAELADRMSRGDDGGVAPRDNAAARGMASATSGNVEAGATGTCTVHLTQIVDTLNAEGASQDYVDAEMARIEAMPSVSRAWESPVAYEISDRSTCERFGVPLGPPGGTALSNDPEVTRWMAGLLGITAAEMHSHFFYDGEEGLGFLYYHLEGSAGSFGLVASMFRKSEGPGYDMIGPVREIYGILPRDVRFEAGSIRVTTQTLAPGDPRCCPSGETRWIIDRQTRLARSS